MDVVNVKCEVYFLPMNVARLSYEVIFDSYWVAVIIGYLISSLVCNFN